MNSEHHISSPEPRHGKSFWKIAYQNFRRNTLAVAGFFIVVFFISVAVFVPLLANNKPLAGKMHLEDQYDNSYFVLLDSLELYKTAASSDESDPEELRKHDDLIRRHSGVMRRNLPRELSTQLVLLEKKYETLIADPSTLDVAAFEALIGEIEEQFDLMNVTLKNRIRFPAFRQIKLYEVFFISLYLMAIVLLIFRKRIRGFPMALLAIVIIASSVTGVWRLFNPPYFDSTNYKVLLPEIEKGQWMIFPLVPYGENENITRDARQKPSWLLSKEQRGQSQGYHLLGTDTNGRDVFCRMIYGTRIAMSVGFVAVGIYVTIGIILGALAGFYRGATDILISRFIEVVMCFPTFFLILIVLAFLRPSIINIMVVLGITGWTGIARLQRGEFLRLVNYDFVQSVRALGGSNFRIIFRHILPNGLGPILVAASFGIAAAILVEAALSFLGFGVPQPTASWGDLIYNGRNDVQGLWWLTIFPGFAIFIAVTAYNLVGEGIRDATDPKLTGVGISR